jgi:hypothetical protein
MKPSASWRLATLLCGVLCMSSRPAYAYRRFNATDAAVAARGEIEVECGPFGYVVDAAERTISAEASCLGRSTVDNDCHGARSQVLRRAQRPRPLARGVDVTVWYGRTAWVRRFVELSRRPVRVTRLIRRPVRRRGAKAADNGGCVPSQPNFLRFLTVSARTLSHVSELRRA